MQNFVGNTPTFDHNQIIVCTCKTALYDSVLCFLACSNFVDTNYTPFQNHKFHHFVLLDKQARTQRAFSRLVWANRTTNERNALTHTASEISGYSDLDRSGSPIPIEYLPAENTLSSKVRLMILYQNRPTTTIAVGDPLTFRLEPQDGYNQMTDIFATNVIARDPYSGRSIQLIDRYGCPVDSFVFPELDKLRTDDSLEARFNAFKIPESNFLVFEATVRSCRDGCQPAYCPGQAGRSEPSFGRRKRSLNETTPDDDEDRVNGTTITTTTTTTAKTTDAVVDDDTKQTTNNDYPEHVREMIEVFDTRDDIFTESVPRKLVAAADSSVCLSASEYHGLIGSVVLLILLLVGFALAAGVAYRRYWLTMLKNRSVDRSRASSFIPSALHQSATSVSHEPFGGANRQQYDQHQQAPAQQQRSNLFNGGLQKTFATG